MPVPTFERFVEPIMRFLATTAHGASARDIDSAAGDALQLSASDRQERIPSGLAYTWKNRCGWARDRLRRNGLLKSPRRNLWVLTETGRAYVGTHPTPWSPEAVATLTAVEATSRDAQVPTTALAAMPPERTTPDERIDAALAELRASVKSQLLDTLSGVRPEDFEDIVLDVLHKLGYGMTREDLQRVGRSGDGGIDGVIALDRLGLERVHVQAKRWSKSVGRPEVHAFYGALAGQRATKGVMITTSTFTAQATEFAASVEGIVLVDGARLADLMIDHGVGVAARTIRVPTVDRDYFEED